MVDMCHRRACAIHYQRLQTDKMFRLDLYDNALGRSGEDDSSNDVIGAYIYCSQVNKNNRSTVPEAYHQEG